MAYCYRVRTLCTATIRETWLVTSDTPLEREDVLVALETRNQAVINLEEETHVSEAQRTVVDIAPLAPTLPRPATH